MDQDLRSGFIRIACDDNVMDCAAYEWRVWISMALLVGVICWLIYDIYGN